MKIFDIPICKSNDHIEPYNYSMSRFSKNDERRLISIPEITAYIDSINYMQNENIFEELIDVSIKNDFSFSKLIQENGEFFKHEIPYGLSEPNELFNKNNSTYISNMIKKLNISKGAKGVLSLDISNFFGSIYTHMFPAITLGYDEALKCFKSSCTTNSTFNKYSNLDKHIRTMNCKRTNGILIGPLINQIISEALLCRIDIELHESSIIFTRYVDDYEVYIYDNKQLEKTISIMSKILSKYHFTFNNEKTNYTEFPYYKTDNLNKIINTYTNKLTSYDLMELFNAFFNLESNGTKGAIRYLVKSISEKKTEDYSDFTDDSELLTTYLLNILVNDNRSLPKVCELLIKEKSNLKIDSNFKKVIKNLLISCINSNKELEVIWILYLIKSINLDSVDSSIINDIIDSKNELAIIIMLHEFNDCIDEYTKNHIIDSSKSWILLYQLYLKDYINENQFITKSGIKHNIKFYNRIKFNKFSFYKNICTH